MRDILFLAHRLPCPPDRGDKIRSYHMLRYLWAQARVHLVTFAEDDAELAAAEALRPMLASLHIERRTASRALGVAKALLGGRAASIALFDSPTMRNAVFRTLSQNDIGTIFAFSGQMAQFVPPNCAARFVMDFVDVDSEKFLAYSYRGPLQLRWLYRREARLLAQYEYATAKTADSALFVSEAEAALFRRITGLDENRVRAIGNGVDLDYWRPDADFEVPDTGLRGKGPLLVFTGQMDYPPNIEAVTRFASTVYPILKARHADLRFAIVGRNPTAQVQKLSRSPGITVTGAVSDVRPWLAAADIVVAPLAIARGIQNKVLEAMAMARPVVASPAAAEGIEAEAGRDLIVARDDQMAAAILALLSDPRELASLGRHARTQVEARYHWEEQLRPLHALLAS